MRIRVAISGLGRIGRRVFKIATVQRTGPASQMNHMCTGGGVSPEFLEGKTLSGVVVLLDRV